MPTLSNKHANVQRIVYPGFSGGLNLSVSPENLAKNELKEAKNVEYSTRTGSMRVRGGLSWSGKFDTKIMSVVPISGRQGFLVRLASGNYGEKTAVYFRWNNIWPVLGEYPQENPPYGLLPSAVLWEYKENEDDENEIPKDCWLIAFGKKLAKFTEAPVPKIETIDNSPVSKLVFVRYGRVGVVSGRDSIILSAVGDCESDSAWTNDPNDESSSQCIDVGYKDGMDITAVVPLSKDLIVFKNPPGEPDKGTIWRVTGSSTADYVVVEVAHNIGTFSQQSVCVVGNDIFFATVSGIATLSTVVSYGEVKTGWPDRKVSNALVPRITDQCKLYDVPVKQQLWVAPNPDSKEIWVFDYGHGIWTTFEFPQKITYAFGVDNRLFVFMGQNIYEVNDDYEQDDLWTDSTRDIEARMKLGTVQSGMQTLIKGIFASFDMRPSNKAVLKLGKYEFPFAYAGAVDYIYDPPNDTQYASEDDDSLFPEGGVLTSRRRCIIREWSFEPLIEITGGGCSVSSIGLEVVEV
jgi:hypothetical protein